MSTTEVVSNDASVSANVDMKLEVVVIPVSDVDRAKEFYRRLGWRLDVTPPSTYTSARRLGARPHIRDGSRAMHHWPWGSASTRSVGPT